MTGGSLSAYASDQSGLVYGYVFSADGGRRQVDTVGTLAWLGGGAARAGEFIWLHFNGSHASTPNWLQQHVAELPEEFIEALHEHYMSTRIEKIHDSLLAVVNDVVYDLMRTASLQVATMWLCVGSRYLVSVRNQPLRSVDRLRASVNAGEPMASPLALLIHLFRDQADVLVQIMRKTTEAVNGIEDSMLAERGPVRTNLGVIRRDLVRLQRLLAPEPAALLRLLNRPPAWVGVDDAQDLQQSTEEFSVVLRDMVGLQERIKMLQEELAAQIGERTNRSVFVLTAVTAIALPINMTAGLFGMNVGGIPFAQDERGFWTVAGLVLMVTALAVWLVFRGRDD